MREDWMKARERMTSNKAEVEGRGERQLASKA